MTLGCHLIYRESLLLTFLAISDQYATFCFKLLVHKLAILDDRKSLLIAFLAISDQYATFLYLNFFTKWPPQAILDYRKSLSIALLAISDQYETFICFDFFHKMAAAGHFKLPQFTFNRISRHFRSIHNFNFFRFFLQNGRRRPFWMTENHFRSPFQINMQLFYFWDFFSQYDRRRPFWMTEYHFRSHFSPFQINTQLFFDIFFTKWPPATILDDRKSLSIPFLAILVFPIISKIDRVLPV